MTNEADWELVGRLLGDARRARKLSKRAAADAAGIADVTWRYLESGKRYLTKDVTTDPSPRDETLAAACKAVGADPEEVFAAAGRELPEWVDADATIRVDWGSEIERLSPDDREQVEALIRRLRR